MHDIEWTILNLKCLHVKASKKPWKDLSKWVAFDWLLKQLTILCVFIKWYKSCIRERLK